MDAESTHHLPREFFEPTPTREHEVLAATGRAGRNLPAAVTTAVLLVAAVAAALFTHPVAFVVLVQILALAAVWEVGGALARVGVRIAMPPLYLGSIGMLVCAWALGAEALMSALFFTVFTAAAWRLVEGRGRDAIADVTASVLTALWVPFLASFTVLILRDFGSPWLIVLYAAVTALNDTGGWAAGVLFGKHPMAPRLSPKKSWEGFAGSVLACVAAGTLGFTLLGAHWAWGLVAGVAAAFLGTLGDLTESLVKREVGLKDMSNLLPGHGGILDRVDALLMTAPLFHLIFVLALGVQG